MRLQKYLASCGVASRRKSEELITAGLVSVNGEKVTELGTAIDPDADVVEVSGKAVRPEKKNYFLFNKPSNVLCTAGNPRGRKTVYDYFKDVDARMFTVGRLDYKTSGLIIVTNDGDFAQHISHPSYEKEKEYSVRIRGSISNADMKALERGMEIDGYRTAPARVELISRSKRSSALNIAIREGRNRQVRKMLERLGYKVVFLQRTRIGHIETGGLKEGNFRELTKEEIALLKK